MCKIHVLGASGSGTTTLGVTLSQKLGIPQFDSDNYYWKKTAIPFTEANPIEVRHSLLLQDIHGFNDWIISGSMDSWSEPFAPMFDLVIFLDVPANTRVERLKKREFQQYGKRILEGGDLRQAHLEFITWAAQYDEGRLPGRSRRRHEEWFRSVQRPLVRIEGDLTLDHVSDIVLSQIQKKMRDVTPASLFIR